MISIQLKGRLGNHMFQYAVCRYIAEKHGFKYSIFGLNNSILSQTFLLPPQTSNDYRIDSTLNDERFNFISDDVNYYDKFVLNDIGNIKDNTSLIGYFTKSIFFENKEIDYFDDPLFIDMERYLELCLKYDPDVYCYIHFRGTDFYQIYQENLKKGRKIYLMEKEYYEQAKTHFPDSKFLIVTDDIKLAKEYFPNDEITNNDYRVDFHLLRNAKKMICSASTFSWWSGYLNKNTKPIYPYGGIMYGQNNEYFYPSDKFIYIK